jgi:predicted O-methyltransferase YrrM
MLRFFPRLVEFERHPRSWAFPRHLESSTEPWVRAIRDLYAHPVAFPSSMSPEAGLLLHALVRNIRPRTVVEVGTFVGVSTIWMAAALEEAASDPGGAPVAPNQTRGIVHCFDVFAPVPRAEWRDAELTEDRLEFVRGWLTRAGLAHRAVFHKGDSAAQLLACRDQLRGTPDPIHPDRHTGGVDFALIDGDHTIKGAVRDLEAVEPVLNPGGYILLHDTFPEECGDHLGPRHIVDHIASVAKGLYQVCDLYTAPLNYGMALLRRIG